MNNRLASLLCITMVLVGTPTAGAAEPPAPVDPTLARRLSVASPDEQVLLFVHGVDTAAARSSVRAAGMRQLDTFDRVGIAVAAGPLGAVAEIRREPGVTLVEAADTPITLFSDTSHIATRGRDVIDGFEVERGPGKGKGKGRRLEVGPYDGSGVSIAIVDSGIFAEHPFFQAASGSKVVRNLVVGCTDTLDPVPVTCPEEHGIGENPMVDAKQNTDITGHGTHVAGIAAGVDMSVGGHRLHGAAPGASLVGLAMPGGVTGAAAALNWVLEHHRAPCGAPSPECPPIRVVNNSWGHDGDYDPEETMNKLQNALIAEGITVVWAAGNTPGDGSANETNAWGSSPTPGSIMVGNYDDWDTGRADLDLDWSSSTGKKGSPETYPDISAPGRLIDSACFLPEHRHLSSHSPTGFCEMSGTSMSAPHVSGIVAQLLEANPDLSPARIEEILEGTANPFGPREGWEPDPANPASFTSFDRGHGMVDAAAAVARGLDLPEPADPEPARVVAPVDGRVSLGEPVYEFLGGPVTNQSYEDWRCDGLPPEFDSISRSEGCHREYVEVEVPPEGAKLRVEISSDAPRSDFDLYLRDPYGSSLGWSIHPAGPAGIGSGIEIITTHIEETGIYTILVPAFNTLEASFEGTVSLEGAGTG